MCAKVRPLLPAHDCPQSRGFEWRTISFAARDGAKAHAFPDFLARSLKPNFARRFSGSSAASAKSRTLIRTSTCTFSRERSARSREPLRGASSAAFAHRAACTWPREPRTGRSTCRQPGASRGLFKLYRGLAVNACLQNSIRPRAASRSQPEARANPGELDSRVGIHFRPPAPRHLRANLPSRPHAAGLFACDRIAHQREDELRWLTSPEIRDAIDRNSVELISYRRPVPS